MTKSLSLSFALAVTVAICFGCAPAERNESGEIDVAGSVDAFTIRVGDCFDDRFNISDEVSDVPGVPCSERHDNEVFATFDLTSSDWPGDDWVTEVADEGCLERFQGYVGATYEESVLMITTLIPSEGSWNQLEDREVVCIAYHMELDKLTGSVRNTGM